MKEVILIYRPYQIAPYVAGVLAAMDILLLLFIGDMIFDIHQSTSIGSILLCAFLAIFLLYFIKFVYDVGKTVIVFAQEGLYLVHCGKTELQFVPWTNFSFVYHHYNYYGIEILVLSSQSLDKKQLKKLSKGRSVHIENYAVVISMDNRTQGEKTAQIREIVKEKVSAKNGK